MSKKFLAGLPALMLALIVLNCGGDDGNPTSSDGSVSDDPSFTTEIQPILSARCATSGCHDGVASGGLILSAGVARGNLVNVASTSENSFQRVKPNDAANSYIVVKLEGRQSVGTRMPQPPLAPLSTNQIQLIRNWIDQGAKDN